jgi:hypothetical protein
VVTKAASLGFTLDFFETVGMWGVTAIMFPFTIYMLIRMATQTIYLTKTQIGHTTLWRTVEYPRTKLGELRLVLEVRGIARWHFVSGISHSGEEIFRLWCYWGRSDLRKLADACGVPFVDRSAVLPAQRGGTKRERSGRTRSRRS